MRGNCYLFALEALFDLYAPLSTGTFTLAATWCGFESESRPVTPDKVPELGDAPVLVHGFIMGDYGKLRGIKFGHAWLEGNGYVMDCGSAEKVHCLGPRDDYYNHWQIDPGDCIRYTIQEVAQRIIATGSDSEWNDHAPDVQRVEISRVEEAARRAGGADEPMGAPADITPSRNSNQRRSSNATG